MAFSFGAVQPTATLEQNKVLRGIVNSPGYIRNTGLHRDLNIETVAEKEYCHTLSDISTGAQ